MAVADFVHAVMNYLLSWLNLVQNSEYGWKSVDRKTGRVVREQQPLAKKLKLLLLFNPLTEWVDRTHAMRAHLHKQIRKREATSASRNRIQAFVDFYKINLDDFSPADISRYSAFEDFFARHLAPGARVIEKEEDASSAVAVADSRVVVYETVSKTRELWIKGASFSISNLVMDRDIGQWFSDDAVASFRLSPQDYHRFHSPATDKIKLFRSMPGDYYQVDPVALHSSVDILTRNARDYVVIQSDPFGEVLFVVIGAEDVGTVEFHPRGKELGAEVRKGDEIGIFQFGGSSIIVASENGRVEFDADLLDLSKNGIQTAVDVGMSLGSVPKRVLASGAESEDCETET